MTTLEVGLTSIMIAVVSVDPSTLTAELVNDETVVVREKDSGDPTTQVQVV